MNITVPAYCIYNKKEIKGFFGPTRFLSNFWSCSIFYEGFHYPSVECAYQAAKTNDIIQRKKFTKITAREAKQEGRELKIRNNWEEVKYDIMAALVFDKFFRNKELRQQLIDTGDAYLQESNHWGDETWGVDVKSGKGKNYLGKILMQVRSFWAWTEKKKLIMHYHNDADYFAGLNFAPHPIAQSG